jgi:hypothetical protein
VKKLLHQLRTNKLSGAIVRSVAKLASITFLGLAFSYWIDYLGFITEEKLAAVLITPSLGVPNWSVIYIINTAPLTSFLAPLPGRKKTSARGVSHTQSLLCFSFALFYFCLHRFIENTKK